MQFQPVPEDALQIAAEVILLLGAWSPRGMFRRGSKDFEWSRKTSGFIRAWAAFCRGGVWGSFHRKGSGGGPSSYLWLIGWLLVFFFSAIVFLRGFLT